VPWFKVDDGFHGHPKVIGLSPSAVGVWLLTGTWSAQYLTDGHVPRGMVTRFGGTDADAADLIAAGLWRAGEDGYEFHEWHEYQPSKETVEAERAAARDRMRERRRNKRGTFAGSSDEQPANVREVFAGSSTTPTQPSPTRPESSNEDSSLPRKRGTTKGTRIPEPFVVTGQMRTDITAECGGIDVDGQTRRFVDYWRAQPGQKGVKTDWIATWRNWMRRAHDDTRSTTSRPTRDDENLAVVARLAAQEAATQKGLSA